MKLNIFFCLALVLGGNGYAAIVYPKVPDEGRQTVYKHLDPKFLGSPAEEVTITNFHREYYVGLTNMASGQLLSAAEPGSWRCLLFHNTNVVGVASLTADKTGRVLGFNSLQKPFFPGATLEALRKMEALPQIKKQNYEVRYLGVPSLNFAAVWLHATTDDIIIPLPPAFERLNEYQPYSEDQIIKVLKKDAKEVMKQPQLIR